jgi:hypothetical protein
VNFDRFKEYGFVYAGALAGIIFAQTVVIGETGTHIDFLMIPAGVLIGYSIGRVIRARMGKKNRDERDIENYEDGMSWGLITFALLVVVDNGTNATISSAAMLMYSTAVALSVTLYREIRQSGVRGLVR